MHQVQCHEIRGAGRAVRLGYEEIWVSRCCGEHAFKLPRSFEMNVINWTDTQRWSFGSRLIPIATIQGRQTRETINGDTRG